MLTMTMLLGLIFAIAFMQSMRFNPRRTEDASHALWNLVGKNIGKLVPTPQYRLYSSERDFVHLLDDPETTMPDSETSEVLPDFVILRFQGIIRPTEIWTCYLSSLAKGKYSADGIQVTACFIPLLVELKRPVSRHCADIDELVSGLSEKILAAQAQVQSQVHCLFSTPKFYRQDRAVAIAAAGDWWSYRLYWRSDSEFQATFRATRYRHEPEEPEPVGLVEPSNTVLMRTMLREVETAPDTVIPL